MSGGDAPDGEKTNRKTAGAKRRMPAPASNFISLKPLLGGKSDAWLLPVRDDSDVNYPSNRRVFLKQSVQSSLVLGLSAAVLSHSASAAEKVSTPTDPQPVMSEEEFRLGVIGPAELSLATSKIAVEKTQNKNAKEFAGFELGEAIAVTTVLKEMDTPVPPMDEKAKAILETLKSTPAGPEFDKAYISAQLENHIFLRKHSASYLTNAPKGKVSMAEKHGRHLATVTGAVFQEHVDITTRILKELMG